MHLKSYQNPISFYLAMAQRVYIENVIYILNLSVESRSGHNKYLENGNVLYIIYSIFHIPN